MREYRQCHSLLFNHSVRDCAYSLSRVWLCDPMDSSLPDFSVHGLLQARILEWIAMSFSRGSFQSRDQTQVSLIAGEFFTVWVTKETPEYWSGFSSVQLLSRVWLCNPMNCSMPGLPVHQQLPESTQTYVHWVGDAIQASHPLSSPSPPALNLSQHQGLFKWVGSLSLLQRIFPTQESNWGLLHCRQILYHLSYPGAQFNLE